MDHFTYENLTEGCRFISIEESQLETFIENMDYYGFVSWQMRNDGHGDPKGGTLGEYRDYLQRVKEFNEKYPNWKNER